MPYRELILGAGSRKTKDLRLPTAAELDIYCALGGPDQLATRLCIDFIDPITLDINSDHKPDIQFNLERIDGEPHNRIPLSSRLPEPGGQNKTPDSHYNEIHAYEVLEHIGRQGDYRKFFAQFEEFWRILIPGGYLFATVPHWAGLWAWGDPSHTRIINAGTLAFLSQAEYVRQVGVTPMSDFRYCYKGNFECVFVREFATDSTIFVLKAVK